jgi:hypothetical protein
LILIAGLEFQVRRRLGGGVTRHRHPVAEADVARIDRIEQEIKRHHLRQRGGIARVVGIAGVEDLVGIGIHHQRSVLFSLGSLTNQQPG